MNNYLDTYEVALVLCDLDPDSNEDFENEDRVDQILYDKYGIEDTNGLDDLIKDLAKLAYREKSYMTGLTYTGFSKDESWLYKIEET